MLQISLARSASAGCSTLPGSVWMLPDAQVPPRFVGEAPLDHEDRRDFQPATLLWIDDEIRPDDAVVRLLELEGFRVQCARSGVMALAVAQRTTYVGIILDLRLPDISGLTVLETLTRQQVAAPVLVLTGYPDFDVAVQAMRLGAWDCQSKTILLGDQWIGVVRALAEHGDKMHSETMGLLSTRGEIVRELLEFLAESAKRPESRSRTTEDVHSEVQQLTLRLLCTLADRRLNVFMFLIGTKALSLALTAPTHALPSVVGEVSGFVKSAMRRDLAMTDQRVQATLSKLAQAETRVGQVREEEIAQMLGVNRAHLGRLLRDATGFTFKQWRWGFLLRPALPLLVTSHEQVSQIAYDCGYESLAQFDRDFRRMLHMTPTKYRQRVHETSL